MEEQSLKPYGRRLDQAAGLNSSLRVLLVVLAFCGAFVLRATGAGAETLQFESQTPGSFSGTIIEGDYEFTSAIASVEPGDPFRTTFRCAGAYGQFIAIEASPLTFARTDGQAFDFLSFTNFVLFP